MKNFKLITTLLLTLAYIGVMAQSGLILNKTVSPTSGWTSNTTGTITLETYVTGQEITQTTTVPCDIVLVLDVSGSMEDEITMATESGWKAYNEGFTYSDVNISNANNAYYYKWNDGNYYQVKTCSYTKWFLFIPFTYSCIYFEVNGTRYYLTETSYKQAKTNTDPTNAAPKDINNNDIDGKLWGLGTNYTGTLYKYTSSSTKLSKMEALKNAVNTFIAKVTANANDNKVDHKISIVKYAMDEYYSSESSLTEGNHKSGGYNYTEVVKNLTTVYDNDNNNNVDALTNAIDLLSEGGATAADYGMTKAKHVLAQVKDTKRQKVIIMFTDGEPNHDNGFTTSVANATIAQSQIMKNDNVLVYTVGIFDNPSTNVTNYMNYVSSNYPNASNMSTPGTKADSKYYKLAKTADELTDIFKTISETIGGASMTLGTTTVIKDIMSEYFKIPDGADASNIILKTATCTGVNDGVYSFGTPVEIHTATVSVPDNKNINITGFNLSDEWCGLANNVARGKKLIIEIPIVYDPNSYLKLREYKDIDYPTNNSTSGVYTADDRLIGLFPIPEVKLTAILPIELLSFTAECMGNATQLAWSTATETNNEYFTIERSEDAVNYTEIARIQGAGTSAEQHDYSYMTNNSSSRMVYYRLRQTDIDGTTEVFEPIAVQCSVMEEAYISMYPVPAKDMVNIESNVNIENVEIFSMQGSLVKQVMANNTRVQINLNNLQAGVFTLRITTANGETMVKKLIKQ